MRIGGTEWDPPSGGAPKEDGLDWYNETVWVTQPGGTERFEIEVQKEGVHMAEAAPLWRQDDPEGEGKKETQDSQRGGRVIMTVDTGLK